ncbi:MAG: DUF2786 domain-containing protein [Rhizobiales bacterium]|nr:DUF2786 domain-containing protein [Hyphomicrobiales bacterium]
MNDIKKKIAALLAKAESTDNDFESELFLSKANELMEKHQINNLDLGIDDPISDEEFMYGSSGIPSWKFSLLCVVSAFYGATVAKSTMGRKTSVRLIGKQSACITVELMFPYLLKQITKQAQKLRSDGYGNKLAQLKVRVSNSLYFRMHEIIRNRRKAVVQNNIDTNNALVIKSELDLYLKTKYSNFVSVKSRGKIVSQASQEAAKKIGLNLQTENKSKTLLLNKVT